MCDDDARAQRALAESEMLSHVSPVGGQMVWQNGKAYEVKRAILNVSSATTTTIVPAPGAGKAIVLLSLVAFLANSQTLKLQDNAGSPAVYINTITGGAGGLIVPFQRNEGGWFQVATGLQLDLVTTAAAVLSGRVTWIEVDV